MGSHLLFHPALAGAVTLIMHTGSFLHLKEFNGTLYPGAEILTDGIFHAVTGCVIRDKDDVVDVDRGITPDSMMEIMIYGNLGRIPACTESSGSGRPRPRPCNRRSCPNGHQRKFFVQPDLPNLHPWWPDEWWFTDPKLPAEISWQFEIEHDIKPVRVSRYDDQNRLGWCRRPLWRCDLTCPTPTLVGPSPYQEPVPF